MHQVWRSTLISLCYPSLPIHPNSTSLGWMVELSSPFILITHSYPTCSYDMRDISLTTEGGTGRNRGWCVPDRHDKGAVIINWYQGGLGIKGAKVWVQAIWGAHLSANTFRGQNLSSAISDNILFRNLIISVSAHATEEVNTNSGINISSNSQKTAECGICLEFFKEPKLLPCSHTFCRYYDNCITKVS